MRRLSEGGAYSSKYGIHLGVIGERTPTIGVGCFAQDTMQYPGQGTIPDHTIQIPAA